jgi:acetylornithine deacetylase/succinyl-diaminopimelate desuccinylase-like protein
MVNEQLMISRENVHEFFKKWIPAMESAQNSGETDEVPANPGDERAAAEVVRSLLPEGDTHITVMEQNFSPGGDRPNILVTYTPDGVNYSLKPILFAGVHMDCVLVQDNKQLEFRLGQDPKFGETIIGRGTLDNGVNVLATAEMLKGLCKFPIEGLNRSVVVAYGADEEASDTNFGFHGLVERGDIDPSKYAAAVFADSMLGAWSTKGIVLYKIGIKVDGPTHSGMGLSAHTVGCDLVSGINRALRTNFPERGPYRLGTILQANLVSKADEGKTTVPLVASYEGCMRSNPQYPLETVFKEIESVVNRFRADLSSNSQYQNFANDIEITFEPNVIEDGYLMDREFEQVAREIIGGAYAATGIEGIPRVVATGGGLPGIRAFSELGLLTLATGVGHPDLEDYHGPEECVATNITKKGGIYMRKVAEGMHQALLDQGK